MEYIYLSLNLKLEQTYKFSFKYILLFFKNKCVSTIGWAQKELHIPPYWVVKWASPLISISTQTLPCLYIAILAATRNCHYHLLSIAWTIASSPPSLSFLITIQTENYICKQGFVILQIHVHTSLLLLHLATTIIVLDIRSSFICWSN